MRKVKRLARPTQICRYFQTQPIIRMQRLSIGRHVLRVLALDGDGGTSDVTRVGVTVRRR